MSKKFLNFSTSKESLKAFILLLNAFVWFFMSSMIIIPSILESSNFDSMEILLLTSYYLAIITSGIIGSILSSKTNRFTFIYSWILLGIIISLLPFLFSTYTFQITLVICISLGASLGLGMPACLAYFADSTTDENRGKTGGLTFLFSSLVGGLLFGLIGSSNLSTILIIFAAWRSTSLIVFFFKETEKKILSERKKNSSFVSVIKDKSFLLFFAAWLMFCFIDRFEDPIQQTALKFSYEIIGSIGPIIGSIAGFIGGMFADRIGRKRILLYTFVTMGVAYAINGFFPAPEVIISPSGVIEVLGLQFLNVITLSILYISAGILWVLFILVLWGDLAKFVTSEKYFAIGIIPFFLTNIVNLFSAEYFKFMDLTRAFSLAAFFLFVAVLPLWISPETLPQKKIEIRRLRNFADEAKRLREKFENKKIS